MPVLIHSGDALHYANDEFLELTGYDSVEELREAGGLGALFADPYPRRGKATAKPTAQLQAADARRAWNFRSRPSCARCRGAAARR